VLAEDDPLRDWLDRCLDLYGGLGRHPGLFPLFGLKQREGDVTCSTARRGLGGIYKRNTGPDRPEPKRSESQKAWLPPEASSTITAPGGREPCPPLWRSTGKALTLAVTCCIAWQELHAPSHPGLSKKPLLLSRFRSIGPARAETGPADLAFA
jgi:hypothetical protein